jgi:hypothetical protein
MEVHQCPLFTELLEIKAYATHPTMIDTAISDQKRALLRGKDPSLVISLGLGLGANDQND